MYILCYAVLSRSIVTLCDPMGCSLPGSSVHGDKARILEWVAMPSLRGSSQLRDQTQVSCIADRFFTSWGTREAQEYWSGLPIASQGTFLTQELNSCLLHCRQILYQLRYQGSPCIYYIFFFFFFFLYYIFFTHSSAEGYLGCFHVLAIVNSVAMNIEVQVSFWISFLWKTRIDTSGSYGSSSFSF